jgi:hypothetical protein
MAARKKAGRKVAARKRAKRATNKRAKSATSKRAKSATSKRAKSATSKRAKSAAKPVKSAAPRKIIGYLCSTTNDASETQEFMDAFKQGLNDNSVEIRDRYAKGKYKFGVDLSKLEEIASEFMTNRVNLIVATGGIMALKAVINVATAMSSVKIPILFVSGVPPLNHPNVSGGINLNMPTSNRQRVEAVRTKYGLGATAKIGLLANHTGAMGPIEGNGWDPAWGAVVAVGQGTEENDGINFNQAVGQLAAVSAGIVVSGDPFFTSKRNRLVDLLNNTGKPVCYPFDVYLKNATRGKSMRFGPDMTSQFKALGAKAKQVLASTVQIPSVGVTSAQNTAKYND